MTLAAINKSGKAPKAGVRRYPSGQIHHADRKPLETEEDIKATALDARLRRDLGVDAWLAARGTPKNMAEARRKMDEPLRGYALGRLLITGRRNAGDGISQAQHDAGDYFIYLYRAKAKVSGVPSPNVRAIDYGAITGLSTHPEHSDEWVAEIRRRWEVMNRTIYDLNQGGVYEAMVRVLIEDKDIETQDQLGLLRLGLNAVGRVR